MTMPATEDNGKLNLASLFKELVTDPLILVLTFAFALLELGNASIFPALIIREKATEAAAKADNATLLRQAQAAGAEQKSLTATAEAQNAARKEAADRRKAQAAALITAAEAEIADAEAANSPIKKSADAAALKARADLDTQKALAEKEKALQANRKLRAELEMQQIALAASKINSMAAKYQLKIDPFADPTYCLLCADKHYVPDLPSGAELPPLPGEPEAPPPPKPVVTKVIRDPFPWQANSPNDNTYSTWTETLPYGAIAAGGHNYSQLGLCSGKSDLETAKRCALQDCGYSNCVVVAQMTNAAAPPSNTASGSTGAGGTRYGAVVPGELNVHAGPNKESSVIGQLQKGQKVEITGHAGGDYITIKATCFDGKSCDGYVNGRAEFIEPLPP